MRRNPDGQADPSGSIASETSRGFTGHEHLEAVGLIHMNGRVYDPLLGRFGTPDPMTEDPFSTQGWNRYSYVGNSPLNFTDPSGYCFLGCFWKPLFKAIGNFFKQAWRSIVQIAVTATCYFVTNGLGGPACAALGGFVSGITSGDLGMAIRGAITSFITAAAFTGVGDAFPSGTLGNIAGHALVGCASAVMQGGKCGPGALSGGISAFASPLIGGRGLSVQKLVANAVIGGVASAAAGGNFANGAVTAAFGYLFNEALHSGEPARGGEPAREFGPSVRTNADGSQTFCFIEGCFTDGIRSPSPFDLDEPITVLAGAGVIKGAVAAGQHIVLRGLGNIGSHGVVDAGVALNSGIRWLGPGYDEIASGVFRSADGLRQFRMTTADLLPTHGSIGPHVHFEALNRSGRVIENLHLPIGR